MPNTTEVQPMDTFQKEITEIKGKLETYNARLYAVERKSDLQDQQIFMLNEKLNKIDENTTWIKRKISGAIITAIVTGAIGGAIAIAYAALQQ